MRPRRARCDISDQRDREESAEPVEANEPIEQIDRNEPADPIERIDPADPIDKIDPFEPIDNSESSDQGDQRDRARTINRVWHRRPPPAGRLAAEVLARHGDQQSVVRMAMDDLASESNDAALHTEEARVASQRCAEIGVRAESSRRTSSRKVPMG